MKRQILTVLVMAALIIFASSAVVQLTQADRWIEGFAYGLLIPIAALTEWWRECRRGERDAADRMIGLVALAMVGGSL